jgi:hypothetical protein
MKTKKETYIIVDYNDLDETVSQFLESKGFVFPNYCDNKYECVAYEEWSRDSSHEFTVDGDMTFVDIQDILSGKLHYRLAAILNWMASENVIDKGFHLIQIL